MQTSFFDGLTPADVSGQHAALRKMIEQTHGVQIPSAARNPLLEEIRALDISPGADLTLTLTLINDLVACDLFDTLLKDTGVAEEGPHPYRIKIEDLANRDPSFAAITLIQTDDGDSLFAVPRDKAEQDATPMVVYDAEEGLHAVGHANHESLRNFILKFFALKNLGNSLMFMAFIENEDVAAFHAVATALYGAPAHLSETCYVYANDNIVIMMTGDDEPTMDLWIPDQAKPWARNADFLRMTELTEEGIAKWAATGP